MRIVREVEYAQAFSFKYSARPGTPAATAENQVPEEVKAARLAELQGLLVIQQKQFNHSLIGARIPVLFEKPGRYDGQVIGRSPYLQAVHVKNDADLIGKMAYVKVIDAQQNSLAGELCDQDGIEGSDANAAAHEA